MEINYTISGSNGQTYGPVSLAELQTWIRDGRVSAQTNVLRSDVNAWHEASKYQELAFAPVIGAPPLASSSGARSIAVGQFPELEKKIKGGAGWFYWIAAFSMINSIFIVTGANWSFFLGLGITQFIAVFCAAMGSAGTAVGLVLSALTSGLFVVFGIFANKRHSWAFIVGMILYLLDGMIFFFLSEWMSFGFHLFAAFCIFAGLKANLDLKKQTGS
ncbi:MAG: hypothetical protein JWM68_104 [Verrucomicrobiales bacterium]|nr:hypothetical protein [Verrucomicrobiales bacterium]